MDFNNKASGFDFRDFVPNLKVPPIFTGVTVTNGYYVVSYDAVRNRRFLQCSL